MKLPATLTIVPPTKDDQGYTTQLQQAYQRIANALNNPDNGTTALRPTADLTVGQFYFDTTLGKPIWWKSIAAGWVDATGASV